MAHLTKQVERDAATRGLYLKVCLQEEGCGTGWLFSCVMFRPAERALSCWDLCLSKPKYPSHSIMRSGRLSLSERDARGIGGPATSEGAGREPALGTMGAEGFVTQTPVPLSTLLLWPPQIGPNNGIVGMPNLSSFARAFAFLLEVSFPDGRKLLKGGGSSCGVICVRPHEMGRQLCQWSVVTILRVSDFLLKAGEITSYPGLPQRAMKDIALKPT